MQEDMMLLTKVSHMYYIDALSQQEIAHLLELSRSKVSRLLQEAKDKGIVEIKIVTSVTRCFELERSIKEIYGISEVIVVPVYSTKEESLLQSLGKAGAEYLLRNVKDGMTVGTALGRTLNEVANTIHSPLPIDCDVVPITGGIGYINPGMHPNDICRKVAEGLGGTAYSLYTPAIVSNKMLKEAIIEDPMIEKVFEKVVNADITMVSAGHVANSTFIKIGSISGEDAEQLQKSGVVGDISSWFINAEGEVLDLEIHDRVVGPHFKEIRKKSKIVLVAGTNLKRDVIAAALRGKLADVLITDENVAKYLIEMA